jgi:hypothetical protein
MGSPSTWYAIVYKSLAAQYRADSPDINYISLPDPLSLDNVTGKKTIQLSYILFFFFFINNFYSKDKI